MNKQLVVHLPPGECGDVADPLPPKVAALVTALAQFGYAPVDFGEDDGDTVELIFQHVGHTAAAQAHAFITDAGA